jgi:hypothetical protein
MNILETYCQTPYGSNYWNIVARKKPECEKKMTLLENLNEFLEKHNPISEIICTHSLMNHFQKLGIDKKLILFPSNLEEIQKMVSPIPSWFLAGSTQDHSLIACLLVDDETHSSMNRPNFTINSFTHEQKLLLSLMGEKELSQSRLFAL